jgi:hypothetical protein
MTAAKLEAILASAKKVCAEQADSLRVHLTAARFGIAARYPLCQAALALWPLEAEIPKLKKQVADFEGFLNGQPLKRAKELLDFFYEQENQKQANEAAALCEKTKEDLPKAQKAYQSSIKWLALHNNMHSYAAKLFKRELSEAKRAKDSKALRALQQVKKRWSNGVRLKDSELRELGILQLLRDKRFKQCRRIAERLPHTWKLWGAAAALVR